MWKQLFFGHKECLISAGTSISQSITQPNSQHSSDTTKGTTSMPRLLVVDDDPTFGKIMERAASKKSAHVTYCESIEDFGALRNWDYDVVIMDYDLGAVTGFELTTYLEQFTAAQVPVILVSQTQRVKSPHWPDAIRKFVHKSLGPFAILEAAVQVHTKKDTH